MASPLEELVKLLRRNPLGATEYIAPNKVPPGALGYTVGNTIYYPNRSTSDNPDVRAHEMIHVGQNRLKYHPTLEQVLKALAPVGYTVTDGASPSERTAEEPAYLLSTSQGFEGQQKAFNNYINLLKMLNNNAYNVEAAAPEVLLRGYINTPGAVPIARPKNPITGQ